MTEARRPSWGHDAYEMAMNLGRRLKRCEDCGAMILLAKAPNGAWLPLEKVGEIPNESFPGKMLHDVVIHHDTCTNARVDGNRDPRISHRIAKNEYETSPLPEGQLQFRPRLQFEG